MSERQRLPNRRASEQFNIHCSALSYTVSASRFSDGRLAEIFITGHKTGTDTDTAARDSAIVCSLALQFGADIDTIRKALCRDAAGRPSGPLATALDILAGDAP